MKPPREKLWVVRPGEAATLADVLRLAGEGPQAVDEGRVFVGPKRAMRDDWPVQPGDAVRIAASRVARTAALRDQVLPEIAILFEKDSLVACIKPAGIPTVPDHDASSHSLVTLVAKRIAVKTSALVVTSRLDREVSGVVVFALGATAAERLRRARSDGLYRRRYIAIAASGAVEIDQPGVWKAPIGRAAVPRLRAANGPDAKVARTAFAPVANSAVEPRFTMLAIDPVTGRTHQIRVHASHAGAPLVGDGDYGGPTRIALPSGTVLAPARIALHAARVVVPGVSEPIEANAPVPAELRQLWNSLGGAPEAWAEALAAKTPEVRRREKAGLERFERRERPDCDEEPER